MNMTPGALSLDFFGHKGFKPLIGPQAGGGINACQLAQSLSGKDSAYQGVIRRELSFSLAVEHRHLFNAGDLSLALQPDLHRPFIPGVKGLVKGPLGQLEDVLGRLGLKIFELAKGLVRDIGKLSVVDIHDLVKLFNIFG